MACHVRFKCTTLWWHEPRVHGASDARMREDASMPGGGDERDLPFGSPRPIDDRLGREIRQEITVVKTRAQLLRHLLRRRVLHCIDLDYDLAESERAVDRLHVRIRRADDEHRPPA